MSLKYYCQSCSVLRAVLHNPGQLCPPAKSVWPCLETILVVTFRMWGGGPLVLVGGGQGTAERSSVHRPAPYHTESSCLSVLV